MDPTTVFCHNRACPARGQTGQGNIGVHSRKDQRFICRQCRKTFTATKGMVFSRRHVVDVERRIVDGTPARVETLRHRAHGDGVSNTAYMG